MENYVTIYEEYRHKFYQLPKVFFTNDKYKNMSNNAKVAWSLLRDRSSLSRKNGWFDEDTGRVYFIYTNVDLMEILNIKSKTTLSNVKKELENAKLIKSVRQGFNKPNKMYLLYPEVTDEDIYKIDELDEYEYEEYERGESSESLGAQGSPENGRPENGRQEVQKVYPSNTDSINTDLKDLDTKDTRDTKKSSQNNNEKKSTSNELKEKEKERLRKKEEYMKKAFYQNQDFIPKELADMLEVFSRTTDEAKKYYDIILIAKSKVEEIRNQVIWLENEPELTQEIIHTFARAVRKIEKEPVDNPKGYLYNSIYRLLDTEISERMRHIKRDNNKDDILYDWLNEN